MFSVHPYLMPVFGGILIGLSALILMMTIGRIAGISGISSSLIESKPQDGKLWRVIFLSGLILGAFILQFSTVFDKPMPETIPLPLLIISGLLVGFGSHLGSGCTSGHGVCGIGRLSHRSIFATCLFMFSAAFTVFISRHIVGV